jgi:ADP-ribose pyrophosphatase
LEERTLTSKHVYQGRVLNLRLDTGELANGATTFREIVEHRGSVAVVAVNGQGKVLLVRQYRKAAEEGLLEIPAGTLDNTENVLECVQRELREETGFRAGKVEKLFSGYISPGYSTEVIHLYLCTDLTPSPLTPDADEAIEV